MDWSKFEPTDFEYDFVRDELFAHRITFKEAVECFYNDFQIRRNKSFSDRFQLIGETFGGRKTEDRFSIENEPYCADNYGMGTMTNNLSENEIDELVIADADNDEAWEKAISVNRKSAFRLGLPKPVDIVSNIEVLGGEPIFSGTRVPVSALLENLESGASLDDFLVNFPTVSREQAVHVLEYFRKSLSTLKEAA